MCQVLKCFTIEIRASLYFEKIIILHNRGNCKFLGQLKENLSSQLLFMRNIWEFLLGGGGLSPRFPLYTVGFV